MSQKMVRIGSEGAALHKREIYAFRHTVGLHYLIPYFTFFMRRSIDRTGQQISTSNGPKDAVWRKEVPFVGGIITKSR